MAWWPGFGGISGLRTTLHGRHYRVTDRHYDGWSAEVNVTTLTRSVGDFDCVTTITEDDQTQRVEIVAEGTFDRNNRTGQVGRTGARFTSPASYGEGFPPDDKLPTATGRIAFDRCGSRARLSPRARCYRRGSIPPRSAADHRAARPVH